MGKVLKSIKSMNDQFQFTLWDNGKNKFVIEIKRFHANEKGYNFFKFDFMTFTPDDFEKFKDWISTFKK